MTKAYLVVMSGKKQLWKREIHDLDIEVPGESYSFVNLFSKNRRIESTPCEVTFSGQIKDKRRMNLVCEGDEVYVSFEEKKNK